ncbi:MAG: glycerophosphodiester phosphodiesterase [Chloroflexota bacterium]
MNRPLLVTAHAGCKGHAPENTLAAIRKAIELGVDAIEVDVHCTADGVPVLIHDDTVDRTTSGTGSIHHMTFAEAQMLDAGDQNFPGEPIPSLEEALELTRGRVLLVLEIKQVGIETQVLALVRCLQALRDCAVHSFFPQVVATVRQLEPRMPCALLTTGVNVSDWEEVLDSTLALNAQGIAVLHSFVTEELVASACRRSLRVYTWTVNEESAIRRLIDCGVDGITSDYPERVRAVLAAS